jgi:3-phenylpropionate/trans-cinnamate dioxygenase ferredoxin subunit
MSEAVTVAKSSDLASGESKRVVVGSRKIALVRIDDEFFAVDDTCSHEDYSLSEGEVWVDECEIECPQHGSTFDLRTGAACSLPATKPVSTYEVKVVGDEVQVVLP